MTDVLICLAKTDEPQETAEGSVIRWCSLCAVEVWVAPKNLPLVDDGTYTPMCSECGVGTMEAEPDARVTATPDADDLERRIVRAWNKMLRERR